MKLVQDASLKFKNLNNRRRINGNVLNFNQAHAETNSEQAAEKTIGIPRSTAQYHTRRQRECDLDDAVLLFFSRMQGILVLSYLQKYEHAQVKCSYRYP
jgi:hypothetical protein